MKVRAEGVVAADGVARGDERRRARARDWALAVLLAGVLAGALFAIYLSIYPVKGFATPLGYDTPEYVWRTKLAQQVGIAEIDQPIPSLGRVKRGRPAYPAVAGVDSSLEGVDPMALAKVLPVAGAAALALVAGAFAMSSLGRREVDAAVVVLGVGISPFMALLLAPESYVDTIFALSMFVAAALFVARLPQERAAVLPAAVLLGVAGLVHFQFFLLMLATLGLVGLVWLPESWRAWRDRTAKAGETRAGRLAMVGAGGSAVALGLLYGVLGNAIPKTRSDLLEFEKKLARDLPEYRFGVTGALAAAGAVGLASETRRERSNQVLRAGFLILIAWGVVVLLGYVAGGVLHLRIPAHRFLSFALTVPLLGAVGLLWIARGVSTLWRPLGAIVVVAGLAVAGVAVHDQWFENKPWIEDGKIQQADTVAAYLQGAHVPVTRPVVFVIGTKDPNGAGLMGHEIRAAIPADRIRHTYVFVGSAEDFLARRAEPDPVSALYLRRMGSVFDQRPVAVITSSYNDTFFGRWAQAHPGSKIDPDVAVVQGPPVPATLPAEAAGASTAVVPPVWSFGLTAVGALLVLGLSGLGWALAVPRRWAGPFEVIALAPAFGVASLTLGGVVADRLGFRPGGLSGALVPAAVAVAGVGVAVWLGRRRERAPVADGPPAA